MSALGKRRTTLRVEDENGYESVSVSLLPARHPHHRWVSQITLHADSPGTGMALDGQEVFVHLTAEKALNLGQALIEFAVEILNDQHGKETKQ